jgi:hypothetical protein
LIHHQSVGTIKADSLEDKVRKARRIAQALLMMHNRQKPMLAEQYRRNAKTAGVNLTMAEERKAKEVLKKRVLTN